ncbi:hypothetical protein RvY_14001 [Ramazzottius varieornatus]|uniref:Uncharacterized protein n=1 Tax=Ramazzottius varieornatus TaxID=947166 RepID=A0A1D1VPW4_RAMVA|nr:hypothetical protein RvY_14001 [Ramazzottius varieornatus]
MWSGIFGQRNRHYGDVGHPHLNGFVPPPGYGPPRVYAATPHTYYGNGAPPVSWGPPPAPVYVQHQRHQRSPGCWFCCFPIPLCIPCDCFDCC